MERELTRREIGETNFYFIKTSKYYSRSKKNFKNNKIWWFENCNLYIYIYYFPHLSYVGMIKLKERSCWI